MKSIIMGASSVMKKSFIGTTNLGFFVDNKDDRIITNAALTQAVGFPVNSALMNPDAGWFKYMDKGKLLYVAKLPFRSSVETNVLESMGIRDGRFTIDIAGKTYKVRLLSGTSDMAALPNGDMTDHAATRDSEFSRLFYRLCKDGGMIGEDRWGEYTLEQLGFSTNYARGSGTLCQEMRSTTSYLIRGATGLKKSHMGNFSGATTARGWRPVLELVG